MDHNVVMMGVFGAAVSIIGWFIRHEYQRNEKIISDIMAELGKISVEFGETRGRIDEFYKLIDYVPDMKRFFGPHGGQARLWGRVEYDAEQFRERLHFIMNKMAIIKGSMEMQNLKCGNKEEFWGLPEWKQYKPDVERQ